jgi:hypothetical protein
MTPPILPRTHPVATIAGLAAIFFQPSFFRD